MNRTRELRERVGGDQLPSFFGGRLPFSHLCLFLLFLCLASHLLIKDSLAQERKEAAPGERIVTGTGIIYKKNTARARSRAISQAFSKALEEYLIQRLGSQDMANNFQRLDEEILSTTKEEIQDYQLISEFMTDKYVRVLMKVRVNEAVVEQKLKNMGLSKSDTVQIDVLFLVSEKKKGSSAIYWWGDPTRQTSLTQTDLSLSRAFEDRGFRIINRSFFPPEGSYDKGMLNAKLSVEEAVKWGKLLSAQIVVAGEANLYRASRASVFLRAVKVADGRVIAQGYREGTVDRKSKRKKSAIGSAINKWAHDMIPHIIEGVKPAQKVVTRIIIMIEGLKSYRALRDFKEFLKESFPEIKSVLERSIKKDLVKVSVKTSGSSKGLAKKVLRHPKRPFSFEVSEIGEQGFTVVIR